MLPPHPTGIHDLRHGDPFQRLLGHELLQRTADGLTSGLGGFIPFSHLTAPIPLRSVKSIAQVKGAVIVHLQAVCIDFKSFFRICPVKNWKIAEF